MKYNEMFKTIKLQVLWGFNQEMKSKPQSKWAHKTNKHSWPGDSALLSDLT